MCTHAFFMCMYTRSMRTRTTRLHTQACVCAHILVPKNPNSTFFVFVSLFLLFHMLLLCLVSCLQVLAFHVCLFVCLSLTC